MAVAGSGKGSVAQPLPSLLQPSLSYCGVSSFSSRRSQEGTAVQVAGVVPYDVEVCCSTF